MKVINSRWFNKKKENKCILVNTGPACPWALSLKANDFQGVWEGNIGLKWVNTFTINIPVIPTGNYMFKDNNRNTITKCEIVNFGQISHLALVFLLLTLSR